MSDFSLSPSLCYHLNGLCHQKTIFQYVREALPLTIGAWFFSPKALQIKINFNFSGNIFPVPCFEITILFRSQFSDHNSFPVPTFESKILFRSSLLRYTFLFRSPILRHTLSLEFLEKCKFIFIC